MTSFLPEGPNAQLRGPGRPRPSGAASSRAACLEGVASSCREDPIIDQKAIGKWLEEHPADVRGTPSEIVEPSEKAVRRHAAEDA